MNKLTDQQIADMMAKEDVEDREHTELSASWAKIWLHCTQATELKKLFPRFEKVEDFTLEGTIAHYLGEQLLLGHIVKEQLPSKYKEVAFYYDTVKEIQKNGNLMVEVKIDMTEILKSHTPIFGRSDSVVLAPDGGIDIIDLKWGQGVAVSAIKNEQEQLYALGTIFFLADMGLIDVDTLDPSTRITLHIVQPRMENSYSYYAIDWGRLLEFRNLVMEKLAEIKVGKLSYSKGDHCQFCQGKVYCPQYLEITKKIIERSKEDMNTLKPEDLAEIYNAKADVLAYFKALEKYMYAQIELAPNKQFYGYTLTTKEGRREVVDEDALIAQFVKMGCPLEELQNVSIVGVSVLDKLAKKYGIAKEEIAGLGKKSSEVITPLADERDNIFGKGE